MMDLLSIAGLMVATLLLMPPITVLFIRYVTFWVDKI